MHDHGNVRHDIGTSTLRKSVREKNEMKSLDFLKIDLIKTIDWPAAKENLLQEKYSIFPKQIQVILKNLRN